jgi:hypothetical protein
MGRTIPSFRIALEMEERDWKPFRNALDKSDRKKFDEMWDLPRWYISACSNSVQYVRLHPILMSILLYHYKHLAKCIKEVEQIETSVNKHRRLTIKVEVQAEKHEEKSKAANHAGQKNNTNIVAVVVPRQEVRKKITKKKMNLRTDVIGEPRLDNYFVSSNKIAES